MKIKGIYSQMFICRVATLGMMLAVLALWSAPARAEACPNEQLRSESDLNPNTQLPFSTELPDCRALEMVTSPFKAGFKPLGGGLTVAGTDGSSFIATSFGSYAGVVDNVGVSGTSYLSTRTSSGWKTTPLDPPASLFPNASLFDATSGNLETTLWEVHPLSQPASQEDLYRREPAGAGGGCSAGGELIEGACWVEIGPMMPPAVATGLTTENESSSEFAEFEGQAPYEGASDDLTHVLFVLKPTGSEGPAYLWPGDRTRAGQSSLYEYFGTGHTGEGGDVPTLVGVDNQGLQISTAGTNIGGARGVNAYNAISAGGSTVFFTTAPTEAGEQRLFARVGVQPASATTVNVAGTSGCESSAFCNVTSPVTFQGASENGSKVFFTAAQAGLAEGDTDATNVLYECELPGDGGAQPPAVGVVDPCPSLKAVSVTGTAEGADVQGVMRISEDGSHVYYVAAGKLASSENAGEETAQPGADNLYVYEPDPEHLGQYRTVFIAMLCSNAEKSGSVVDARCASSLSAGTADAKDWREEDSHPAQMTSDGQFLVFDSVADLTLGDTSSVAQVFRYDAQNESLVRVSQGYENDGNTNVYEAGIQSPGYAGVSSPAGSAEARDLSEDGSYVFFDSADALTPQASTGTNNVYEWHEGDVSLIAGGAAVGTGGSEETRSLIETNLIGATPAGRDVFFNTVEQLVPEDTDTQTDVYDARVEGGFPAPVSPAACAGEACQESQGGAFSPVLPGSAGVPALANASPQATTVPPPKALTRAQKLADALKACRSVSKQTRALKRKRAACEARARKRYGARTKAKTKKNKKSKAGKKNGRGK